MASIAASRSGAEYGRRLLPSLVDEMALAIPDHVYASLPRNQDFTGGFHDVTSRTLACAVNRTAFWIDGKLGRSCNFETIAYLGPMDLRYYIVVLAAAKVGYKTLLPSPRNSLEGHLALLESLNCSVLISPVESKVDHIISKRNVRHLVIEGLQELLRGDFSKHYEYNKKFEEAAHDPFVVVQTSGSTGLPKPIILYHGGVATVDRNHVLSSLDGFDAQIKVSTGPVRIFTSLPPFHVAGILQTLSTSLYFEGTTVWPPPGRPISVDLIDDLLDNATVDLVFLAPSTLEEVSQSQTSLEKLKKVKYAQYAGGPLGKSAGDMISRYTTVLNVMGSSECGIFPLLHKDPQDWNYFHFDPRMKGIEFREIELGLYEQIFTRHESTDDFHWSFYTFPDRSEFLTNDIYSKHPSKPDLWLYEGRSDDVIVLSNGEKFNPHDMEATLRSHPGVFGVLIVGQARFEVAALLELKESNLDTNEARKEALESLLPYIDKANEGAPAYAKLDVNHIFFTKAGKPLLRTDKGTVKRRATNEIYGEEIEKLYEQVAGFEDSSNTVQLDPKDQDSLGAGIHNMLEKMAGFQNITWELDLFSMGMDSLQVMKLVRQLRSSVRDHDGGALAHLLSPKTVYSNPTILKLAAAVHDLADRGVAASEGMERERIGKMEEILAKYSRDLPQPQIGITRCRDRGLTVILTGSTGSLGSYLLECLLVSERVTKVICLNRGSDAQTKQKKSNQSRGLITDWGNKICFLATDLSKSHLGLSADEYDFLVKEASFIIHNQWQVDFNLNLESFEPHIAGVRNLINLSNQSPKNPPILFTSSISTLDNWAAKYPDDKVPESAFFDPGVPAAMGYAESKYIAEQLLEKAREISGVSAAICRVGQLAGPVVKGGTWNKQEWLPSLVASSKYLCKIPTTIPGQDNVPWIPIDTAAKILVDLLLSDMKLESSTTPWTLYHNVVNPHPGSWAALVPAITQHFFDKKKDNNHNNPRIIKPVSFPSWLEALTATSSQTEDAAVVVRNPGIKLLGFFAQMATAVGSGLELETARTVGRSVTMGELRAVGPEWMGLWMERWDF